MRINKNYSLRVREIIRTPAINKELKTVLPLEQEREERKGKKRDYRKDTGPAVYNTRFLLEEIDRGFLEGVKGSLKEETIDNEKVFTGIVMEGPKGDKAEIQIVFRKISEGLFEIYLPHAPGKAGGQTIWKNYPVKEELISKLFGVDVKA